MVTSVQSFSSSCVEISGSCVEIAPTLIQELAEPKVKKSGSNEGRDIIKPTFNIGRGIGFIVSDSKQLSITVITSQPIMGGASKLSHEGGRKRVEYYSTCNAQMAIDDAHVIHNSDLAKGQSETWN